jgi:hypothetical protein
MDEIALQPNETLHGIVFAAACDFSKKARDQYFEKCRALGIQEVYLWGKAEIEDLLFRPQNDHLLFAYFGFSLTIRQRTIQATLRRDIATKRRLKTVVERNANRVLIIRNASGDLYPKSPPLKGKFAADHWRLCPFEQLGYEGLEVEYADYLAFFDGQAWDAADAVGLERSHFHLRRAWQGREGNEPYEFASKIWETFGQDRAWLRLVGVIPYNRILAVDDVGDEYFELPQIYCRYEGRWPFSTIYGSIDRVERTGNSDIKWVERDDPARIQRFPTEFRHEDVLAKGGAQQSFEVNPEDDPASPATREEPS